MRTLSAAIVCLLIPPASVLAGPPSPRPCEPWQSEYAGDCATGKHVLALWPFNADAEGKDASGRSHDAKLVGAKINPAGRFGACLECFAGWPVEDKPHRALVPNHPGLTPKGAFTIELWISPKPEMNAEYLESFLMDKKYVAHADYQLVLGAAGRGGDRVLRMCLGFGDDSSTWYADPLRFEPGRWYHVAFTYDGQGTGAFLVDGVPRGRTTVPGRAGIAAGPHGLSIGDRVGSYHHGFPGLIDQVRISDGVLEFRRAAIEMVSDRACFVRMEAGAAVRLAVTNLQAVPIDEGAATVSLEGTARETKLAGLAPGKSQEIAFPIDTRLRPGEYRVLVDVKVEKPEALGSRDAHSVRIVPRPLPDRMPVVMWGGYGATSREIERLKSIGFTHALGLGADYGAIFDAGGPVPPGKPEAVAASKKTLDDALAAGLRVAASLSPASAMQSREPLRRVARDGKPYAREDICGLSPRIEAFCHNVGASMAQAYGGFPAFDAALIHTEVRDGAGPCFHEHDREAFRKATGLEIPTEVAGSHGVDYARLKGFPADRVIPDDHPILVYYKWYWKQGDGWNALNTAVARGLKWTGRKDLWTWHDPAVRVASVYGSGGEVDYLSQWTYSYPDPIRIGLATDELVAMAAPLAPKQQVMKMTQIIWYRGQTAPEPKKPEDRLSYRARWEIDEADAPFITIAPMHLREAFWTKIARPIQGIMYHGWQSLVPCEPQSGYRYTNPETQHELARLVREVIGPLGPMLRRVPGAKSDVAFLKSFSSEMFARRGTYGWGGSWAGDCWHVLQWAHLQPEIVFDETIAGRGLDGFRVLVMPDCDVLTRSVAERVKAFQAAGGLVVGDERLSPAVKPDIVIPVYQRTGKAKEDKAAMQALAAELRKKLDGRYSRHVDTSDPEVVPYRRAFEGSDYVFVVNDRREYGDYVGQHGLVMENGLPSDAVVTVRRGEGTVYDLLSHQEVSARAKDGALHWDVHLGPCDGWVYLVTPKPIAAVRVAVPPQVERGASAAALIEVVDAAGKPVGAVVPVEVAIRDPEGRLAEFSGSWAAMGGRLEIKLDVAPNDVPGVWQVTARELASGRAASGYFRVAGPQPWPPVKAPPPKSAAEAVQPKG